MTSVAKTTEFYATSDSWKSTKLSNDIIINVLHFLTAIGKLRNRNVFSELFFTQNSSRALFMTKSEMTQIQIFTF